LIFRMGHTQEFDAKFDLMDSRTSQKMETVQKDRLVAYPVWRQAKEDYDSLEKGIPEDEKWKILKEDPIVGRTVGGVAQQLVPSDTKTPSEILNKAIIETRRNLEYMRQSSTSQEQQADDTHETSINIITPIKRLEQHGVRMYAESGIHALRRTKDPNNPVVVAIENLFPERFGGHLEEVKWIIKKSRERMVELLTEPRIIRGVSRAPTEMNEEKLNAVVIPGGKSMLQENQFYMGISKEEAEKLADTHIKVTLDTGHLNMWRKFWQEDPKLNREQNDTKFKEWYLNQVESLAKEGMVGNVHLADNYGYQDDHLSPGQGNAPIKEAISILKKNTDMIVQLLLNRAQTQQLI